MEKKKVEEQKAKVEKELKDADINQIGNLILNGVIISGSQKIVILNDNNVHYKLHEGQVLKQWIISKINRKSVIFLKQNKTHILYLDKTNKDF